MADDIVKRLRDSEWEDVLHELAADEIERLRHSERQWMDAANDLLATNDRLREALDSFASAVERFVANTDPRPTVYVLASAARKARAALAGSDQPGAKVADGRGAEPASEPLAHDWRPFNLYSACRRCGVIRRADDEHRPCPGPVKITPRDASQPRGAQS